MTATSEPQLKQGDLVYENGEWSIGKITYVADNGYAYVDFPLVGIGLFAPEALTHREEAEDSTQVPWRVDIDDHIDWTAA